MSKSRLILGMLLECAKAANCGKGYVGVVLRKALHRESTREYNRRWRVTNPEKVREASRRYNLRRKAARQETAS